MSRWAMRRGPLLMVCRRYLKCRRHDEHSIPYRPGGRGRWRGLERLAESVGRLCEVIAIRHVARYFGLDWKTVKDLDRARLERSLGPVDLDGIEIIALDEFAIHEGHRYATVILEPTRKRVLWVGRGRGREDVHPFFALLDPQRGRRLRAAVMDMNAGYEREVRQHCPSAAIVSLSTCCAMP